MSLYRLAKEVDLFFVSTSTAPSCTIWQSDDRQTNTSQLGAKRSDPSRVPDQAMPGWRTQTAQDRLTPGSQTLPDAARCSQREQAGAASEVQSGVFGRGI
jgi:hypothetical protein